MMCSMCWCVAVFWSTAKGSCVGANKEGDGKVDGEGVCSVVDWFLLPMMTLAQGPY